MEVLDLRAKEYKVLFDKGTSLAFTLVYLGADESILDLTGYTAHLSVWPEKSGATIPSIIKSSPCDEISLVTGNAVLDNGSTLTDVHGVAILFADEQTSGFTWEGAKFIITLEDPLGQVLPFVKGVFCCG